MEYQIVRYTVLALAIVSSFSCAPTKTEVERDAFRNFLLCWNQYQDRETVEAAIKQLGAVRSESAIPVLARVITDFPDYDYRGITSPPWDPTFLCAEALGRIGSPAISQIATLLEHDKVMVRQRALTALSCMYPDEERAVLMLEKVRDSDPSEPNRRCAERILSGKVVIEW